MKLWSIQPIERWQRLQAEGKLRALRIDRDTLNPAAYAFMRERLTAKAGSAPDDRCWPIWAWSQYEGKKKTRPDLRSSSLLSAGTRGVRLHLEIDESRVLLSDFSLWHVPLNCGAIFDRWEDVEAFDEELKEAGFPTSRSWEELEAMLAHPQFGQRLKDSWDKIFALDWYNPDWNRPRSEKRIQAVFWEIRREDVKKVDFFSAR